MTHLICWKRALVVGTALAGLASPALAQTTQEDAGASEQQQAPDIIVTANRRDQSDLSVAAAVTALSAEMLEQAIIRDTQDLTQLAPGLVITTATSEATAATIRLRGIGTSGTNLGLEGSVGVFVDNIYRARSGIALGDLFDVAQVEVLRGPQGTLFGKNTTAGALLVQTRAPTYDWNGEVQAAYGNRDSLRLMGALGGVIVEDKVAFRVSGVVTRRDGFLEDRGTGLQVNDRDRFALRGQLLLDPTDRVSIRLIADYSRKQEQCCAAIVTQNGGRAPAIAALGGFVPTAFDEYVVASNRRYQADTREWGLSSQIDVRFDKAQWTTLLSWRDFTSARNTDSDFTSADLLNTPFEDTSDRFFTAETTLKGTAGPVDWLVGGFLFDQQTDQSSAILFGRDLERFLQLSFPAAATRLVGLYPQGGGDTQRNFTQSAFGWSLFTHNIVTIIPDVKATLGLRYLKEDKEGSGRFAFNSPACGRVGVPVGAQLLCPTPDFDSRFEDEQVIGTAGLSWEPAPGALLYANFSRGYKAGGLNLDRTGGLAGAAGATFLPEEIDSYEVGAKARLLGGKARVALTLFTSDITNFQQNAFTGTAFTISNAAEVRSRGVEFETTLRPVPWLSFANSVIYNEATYGEATANAALRGRQIVNAPKWTWQSQFMIERPVGKGGWTTQWAANMRMISDVNTSVALQPEAEEDGYFLLGGRIGLRSPDDSFDVSLFAQNLTNTFYRTIIFAGVLQPGTFNAYVGEPRHYGVEARVRF